MKLRSFLRILITLILLAIATAFVVTLSSPDIIPTRTITKTINHAPMLR